MARLLNTVFISSLRVENAASSLSCMLSLFYVVGTCTGFYFQRILHSCSLFQRHMHIHRAFSSDLERYMVSLGSAHTPAENNRDQPLYDESNAGCVSGGITTFLASSSTVASSCIDRGQILFRVLIGDFRIVVRATGGRPLRKRHMSRPVHSSQKPYRAFW